MASKRRLRRNACDGKKRHPDKPTALKVHWAVKRKHGKMRAYQCRWCNGWHLGH
jgi:hypothetical protein